MRQTSIVGFPDTLKSLPQAEQKALQTALDQAASITNQAQQQSVLQAITAVVAVRRREQMQKESNRRTERARRHLIGAHVPLKLYERCVEAAEGEAISLYRFRGQCPGSGLPAARNAALGGSFSSLGQASVSGAGGLLPSPWFRQGPRRGSPSKRGRGGRSARGRASRPVPRPRAGVRRGLLAPSPVAPPVAQVVSACASPWNHRGRATRPSRASLVALSNGGLWCVACVYRLFRLPLSLWRPRQGLRKWPQAATLDGAAATRCQPEKLSNERSYKP